ncbi:MAG: T9SS type A sorting domain-containing protein [Ignavibacteriales bacterium]|nr:MAG: T9SS type A sorting domain-containing protein [Ignavibacteriales bacterium]
MRQLIVLFSFLFSFVVIQAQDTHVRPGTKQSEQNTPANLHQTDALQFEDLFNGPNEIADLQARGWVVINQDGGGTQAAWFTPDGTVFPAFEGPTTGFVASNYQGANGFYINHWLISPLVGVSSGDTLTFYHRSPDANAWDDSLYVRVSPTGGSTIPDFTISTPRFITSEAGWAQYTYIFNVSGMVRFAIQYVIYDGGPSGTYSNYIGIDAVRVNGQGFVPVELTSFKANVSDNNVSLNWETASELNNRGFEIQRLVGEEFQVIGFVEGNGTTSETNRYSYLDKNLGEGTYSYRLKQIDFDGTFEYSQVVEADVVSPVEFALEQNYPNPFNPSTVINFGLKVDSKVSLKLFNVLGQEVATLINQDYAAGSHNFDFNAANLNSGVYFYRIDAAGIDGTNFSATKKMILTK